MNLNVLQQRRLNAVPESAKGGFVRAITGLASPRGAIKAMCLECMGYLRPAVRDCTAMACPLYAYRPFQNVSRSSPEADLEDLSDDDSQG